VSQLSDEQRKSLVSACVQEIAGNYGNTILGSSARNRYLTERIERITDRTLWAIGEQTKRGEMTPVEFELDFSGKQDPALKLPLDEETTMELKGRIDRVDVFEDDASVYVRILDYKSGSESFDLNRIYRGLQLQLVVYLGAALDRERKRCPDKQVEPAGVFYFHIGDPVIDSDQPLTVEAARSRILEKMKLDGLVLAEEKAIRLQDREFTGKSKVIPVTEKDGIIVFDKSSVAGRQQFEQLSAHVQKKMLEFGRGIADGEIPVNPYQLKQRSACDYCEFSSVCGFDTRIPGYRYRRMRIFDDGQIWEEMSKYTSEGGEHHGESMDR
jgi:ATP-dependent helicase/nuclease subunit B